MKKRIKELAPLVQRFNGLSARYGKHPEETREDLVEVIKELSAKLEEIINDQN